MKSGGHGRDWPGYLFGGRVRTSTVVLLLAFVLTWWAYDTYQSDAALQQVPAREVVPPGFVPDPAYTWVPRTQVQPPPQTSPTTTEAAPTTTEPTPTPETGAPPNGPPPLPLPSPFGTLPAVEPPPPPTPQPPGAPPVPVPDRASTPPPPG